MYRAWKIQRQNVIARSLSAILASLVVSTLVVGFLGGCKSQQLLPPGLVPSQSRSNEPSFQQLLDIESKQDPRYRQSAKATTPSPEKLSGGRRQSKNSVRTTADGSELASSQRDGDELAVDDGELNVQKRFADKLAQTEQALMARSRRISSQVDQADEEVYQGSISDDEDFADEDSSEPFVIHLNDASPESTYDLDVRPGQGRAERSIADRGPAPMPEDAVRGTSDYIEAKPIPRTLAKLKPPREIAEQQPIRQPADSPVSYASGEVSKADHAAVQHAIHNLSPPADKSEAAIEVARQELSAEEHVRAAAEERAAEDPAIGPHEKLQRQVSARWLYLEAGDIDQAMEPIPDLPDNHQSFIQHTMQARYDATHSAGPPDEKRRWTLVASSLRKALDAVTAMSDLEVHNVAFCQEVASFGVVTTFPANDFKPDQEVLLYCELENFVAQQVSGGYETKLEASYGIFDSNGRRIASEKLPADSHVCRNQRRDYFIAYRIYMPQSITPGSYKLQLTIHDVKGDKYGQGDIVFKVVN